MEILESLFSRERAKFLLQKGLYYLSAFSVLTFYWLVFLHVYGFIKVICPLLKSRLGTELGMTWIAVALILLFNILFNHFWAMALKPGSVQDMKMVEKMRREQKNRAYRKSVDKILDNEQED